MSDNNKRMTIFQININSQDDPQAVANILNMLCSMLESPQSNTSFEDMFTSIFGPDHAQEISNQINSLMDNPDLFESNVFNDGYDMDFENDPMLQALSENMRLDLLDTQVVGDHQAEAHDWIMNAYNKYRS